jgi:prepilin-type N-terminal cleavage/methylation domain-containing protein
MKMQLATSFSTRRQQPGFTIVELLIVIVIIGILAAITIVAYNGIQDRARTSALVSGFKSIDKAFRLLATDQSLSTWWPDSSQSLTGVTGGSNPKIQDIIAASNLKNYLQQAPTVTGLESGFWWYDNDNDTYNPAECLSSTNGVNIVFTDVSQAIALQVDKTLDDGNLSCGKVRMNTVSGVNRIFYSLSDGQQP